MMTIRRVAVLGAGTMGSRIAAHFANAQVPADLLDIVIPGADRSAAARKGLDGAVKGKPPGLFTAGSAGLVSVGNFEDHLERVRNADWIIEAVTENLEIKRDLWRRVLAVARPDAILSTNTSGIPLRQISEGWPDEAARRFLGTHFFNPPRYLHLLEVIPGALTDAAILAAVTEFGDRRLGRAWFRARTRRTLLPIASGASLEARCTR